MTETEFRGWFHAGVGVLVATMAGYNAMRLVSTGHRQNAINCMLYAPLTVWELIQARKHWLEDKDKQ